MACVFDTPMHANGGCIFDAQDATISGEKPRPFSRIIVGGQSAPKKQSKKPFEDDRDLHRLHVIQTNNAIVHMCMEAFLEAVERG